ncbi:unnamed protein product [Psylliodes chrysocephalus]|uniref:Uncharacterized protein n=1 Tax=Psylliodes chrysocephalus TaxID=3402493 RepID=A0A9P0CXF6_9CUCU|nr:unnamed protein product [Psylliodes chrysocephala]
MNRNIPGDTFEGTNHTCYDFMPYNFRIPFPTESKRNCILALTFLDLSFATWAFIISYYDGLFVGMLKCLKVQLVIASHVISTIRQRSLRKLKMQENMEIMRDDEYPELENEMYCQFNHVIKHTQLLFSVRDDIEGLLTFVTLFQTLSSLFMFASCMFVASIVPMSSPEFFAQMEFFISILIQLATMCWAANEITIAGHYLGTELFHSNWLSSSRRFKSSMLITMIRMQRPIILTIGKFTPLTITTLVNVCRGSFSYFAVFKTV